MKVNPETGEVITLDTEIAEPAMSIEGFAEGSKQMKAFVAGQLSEGMDGDFAVIPGCKKKSLLKPGAEKLLKLFGFKSKMICTNSIIDYDKPIGLYEYKCQVGKYAADGVFYVFAECEAVCSTEESKYKYRTEWKNNVKTKIEDFDRMNGLNTMKKMAQKRALVGAAIIACAASNYFTQDMEDVTANKAAAQGAPSQQTNRTPSNKNAPGPLQQRLGKINEVLLARVGDDQEKADALLNAITGQDPKYPGLKDFNHLSNVVKKMARDNPKAAEAKLYYVERDLGDPGLITQMMFDAGLADETESEEVDPIGQDTGKEDPFPF